MLVFLLDSKEILGKKLDQEVSIVQLFFNSFTWKNEKFTLKSEEVNYYSEINTVKAF